jgi:hypothetical protein
MWHKDRQTHTKTPSEHKTNSTQTQFIKTHTENEPIRPVVNYTHAQSYKIAKYLNKRLNNLISLPYTYTTKNSYETAQKLNNIQISKHNRMITLDIKDLYVNLPIKTFFTLLNFG